jgi:hypothetical protein
MAELLDSRGEGRIQSWQRRVGFYIRNVWSGALWQIYRMPGQMIVEKPEEKGGYAYAYHSAASWMSSKAR